MSAKELVSERLRCFGCHELTGEPHICENGHTLCCCCLEKILDQRCYCNSTVWHHSFYLPCIAERLGVEFKCLQCNSAHSFCSIDAHRRICPSNLHVCPIDDCYASCKATDMKSHLVQAHSNDHKLCYFSNNVPYYIVALPRDGTLLIVLDDVCLLLRVDTMLRSGSVHISRYGQARVVGRMTSLDDGGYEREGIDFEVPQMEDSDCAEMLTSFPLVCYAKTDHDPNLTLVTPSLSTALQKVHRGNRIRKGSMNRPGRNCLFLKLTLKTCFST